MPTRVKSLLLALCAVLNCLPYALPQSQGTDCRPCGVVERALNDLRNVKVGMTRRDLEKSFVAAGGMTFRTRTSYVYRGCNYLKVDVDFRAAPQTENSFSPDDEITAVSQIIVAYPSKD